MPWRTAFATFALALFAAFVPGAAGAQRAAWEPTAEGLAPIPPLAARVTDLTHTLSAAEVQALDAKLADWEARTTNQLAVLIVPSTQPEPIEAYSIRVAEAWKIGRKGNDNGVLFIVAKNDRRMRIEVGYGLEGTLTDVTSHRIITEDVAPLFREGKYAAGINAAVDRIISVVAEGKPLPPRPAQSPARAGHGFDLGTLFVVLFVVVPVAGGILRALFGRLPGALVGGGVIGAVAWFIAGSLAIAIIAAIVAFILMIFFAAGGGFVRRGGWPMSGGGWTSGGGFSGGGISGGGGFSGGGGSFGGGGASGNW
jgi:uncharacterized protein